MADFFSMGGYAAYVWPSYGLAALILVGLVVASIRGLRAREATLKALEGSRPARHRRRGGGDRRVDGPAEGVGAGVGEG